jgi:hypothetical protein
MMIDSDIHHVRCYVRAQTEQACHWYADIAQLFCSFVLLRRLYESVRCDSATSNYRVLVHMALA